MIHVAKGLLASLIHDVVIIARAFRLVAFRHTSSFGFFTASGTVLFANA